MLHTRFFNRPYTILVPQGIGDSVWAMVKIQDLAKQLSLNNRVHILISCTSLSTSLEMRSLEFISRFRFVISAKMYQIPILNYRNPATPEGYYNYIPDGKPTDSKIDYVMIPNAPLERGVRLEDWLPEYQCNWDIMDEWQISPEELSVAQKIKDEHGDYIVFYMSGASGNSVDGHNRGPIWKPQDWIDLGQLLHDQYGVKIVVIGAKYDKSYYDEEILPLLNDRNFWIDTIGKTTIGEVLSISKYAQYIISYQGGLAMVANYMGVPAAIFWRPKGDSINPNTYLSFEEDMATAWVSPKMLTNGAFLPLIYGRHDPKYIAKEVQKRGW